MAIRTKNTSQFDGQKLYGFLKNAYDEYLASRTLLNHNLFLQGVILANTSIEKYLKAILTMQGHAVKHNHNIYDRLPSIKLIDESLYDKLDKAFIKSIDSCYALRYIDSFPKDLKIVLLRKQVLAELDYTISLLHDQTKIDSNKNEAYKSQYDVDKENNRKELYENNYLLNQIPKDTFLSGGDDGIQFLKDSIGNFFELKYRTRPQ